jgi:hypothetical protein
MVEESLDLLIQKLDLILPTSKYCVLFGLALEGLLSTLTEGPSLSYQ